MASVRMSMARTMHGRSLFVARAALGRLAERDLLKLPNVLAVDLGIKEAAGEFTKELSYRVYVTAKQDDAALGASAIPKSM